jgi:hypothetical protein
MPFLSAYGWTDRIALQKFIWDFSLPHRMWSLILDAYGSSSCILPLQGHEHRAERVLWTGVRRTHLCMCRTGSGSGSGARLRTADAKPVKVALRTWDKSAENQEELLKRTKHLKRGLHTRHWRILDEGPDTNLTQPSYRPGHRPDIRFVRLSHREPWRPWEFLKSAPAGRC